MFFGTINDWAPQGSVISWHPSEKAYKKAARAKLNPIRVSYQQSQHLRSFREKAAQGRDVPRLCIGAWDIVGICDVPVMTDAINKHVQRQPTYHSWFAFDDADEIVRRTINRPDTLEFLPADNGVMTPAEIRDHILSTPNPLEWDCFGFGIVQSEDHFTFYAAIDHLLTDGMSAGAIFMDIHSTYTSKLAGTDVEFPDPANYVDYCAQQRNYTDGLTVDSAEVRTWHRFAEANGGTLPSFPLPLGDQSVIDKGAITVFPLMDKQQTDRFESRCREVGARFSGGVFACVALAEHELTGSDTYFGLTPFDTRRAPAEYLTVGWYASFIPMAVPTAGRSFAEAALAAQHSFDGSRHLGGVPFYHILDMPAPEFGSIKLSDRPVPMVSYIDIRRIPLSSHWDELNAGIYSDDRSTEGVCMWVNRFQNETSLAIQYPDNPIARDSITKYAENIQSIFGQVLDCNLADRADIDELLTCAS
jgi:hypothetical protein